MKLKVRTLKNDEIEIEVLKTDSIEDLKKKVYQQLPNMEVDRQKLIHAGKILSNDQTVEAYTDIKDNDKIVVMVTKASARPPAVPDAASTATTTAATTTTTSAAAAPAATTATATSSTNVEASSATSSTAQPSVATSTTATTATTATTTADNYHSGTATSSTTTSTATTAEDTAGTTATSGSSSIEGGYQNAASELLVGEQLEQTIQNIVAMGFETTQVQAAMRAAFNNPNRAVDYLMNGIPSVGSGEADNPPSPPSGGEGGRTATGTTEGLSSVVLGPTGGAAIPSGNPLAALRSHPQFEDIRRMLRDNPAVLPQVLDHIGQTNPALLQLINNSPTDFLALLEGPPAEGGDWEVGRGGAASAGAHNDAVVIQLTESEMISLQRLEALGFSRGAVEEAFIACDRNEELAANYLFENANEYMDDGGTESGGVGGSDVSGNVEEQ